MLAVNPHLLLLLFFQGEIGRGVLHIPRPFRGTCLLPGFLEWRSPHSINPEQVMRELHRKNTHDHKNTQEYLLAVVSFDLLFDFC
jgi:hypothetical protein